MNNINKDFCCDDFFKGKKNTKPKSQYKIPQRFFKQNKPAKPTKENCHTKINSILQNRKEIKFSFWFP